jgi:hypothetical protein
LAAVAKAWDCGALIRYNDLDHPGGATKRRGAMFSFCPNCGGSIDQEQTVGQMLTCKHCGKAIGLVAAPPPPKVVSEADELLAAGKAARCLLCQQLIEVRTDPAGTKVFVPHYAASFQRKICPNSGKPVAPAAAPAPAVAAPPAAPRRTPGGKDLSAYMTRDFIRVVSCQKTADPRIEELTLEYLDKSDRVRIQIEALRDILGADFRMRSYPAALRRNHLAVWGGAAACVIAARHAQGGFQSLIDADLRLVVEDLRQQRDLFFA